MPYFRVSEQPAGNRILESNRLGTSYGSNHNVEANSITVMKITPWLMLFSRTLLFAMFQLLIAAVLSLTESSAPWNDSAGWWTFSALLTNIVSIVLLVRLFHQERKSFFNFLPFSFQTVWKDLGITLLLMVVLTPLATYPGQWLANWLYGSVETVYSLFFQPLPLWAGIVSFLFPITIAFAELPTYFGYVMPRLSNLLSSGWLAFGIAAFFLAFQHITLPLIFDWRFMLWRFGMFLPLALMMALCLKIRPRLFPYFMVCHALVDMMTVVMILSL